MGLLDNLTQDQKNALSTGLLSLGAGMLTNSTGHYGQFAPALGAGIESGLGGIQGYYAAKNARALEEQDIALKAQQAQQAAIGTQGGQMDLDMRRNTLAALQGAPMLPGAKGNPSPVAPGMIPMQGGMPQAQPGMAPGMQGGMPQMQPGMPQAGAPGMVPGMGVGVPGVGMTGVRGASALQTAQAYRQLSQRLLGVNPQLATQYAEMATKMEDMAPKFKADTITVQDATGHPTQFAINDAGQQVALGSAPVKLERVGLGSTNVAVDPYTGLPVTGNKIDVSPDTLASNANARQIAQMNIRKDYAINGLNPDGSMPAGLDSVVQGIYEGRIAPPSGQALTRPMGEVLMRRLTQLHPDYDATQYAGREQAVKSFSTGDLGNMIRSNSVATDHLGQLSGLVDQLGNGPIQATNYVKNNVGRWFGSTAATNLDAVKQVVSQEVTKSIVAGGGGQAEREALAEQLSHAATPAQLKGVIEQYQGLMQAQNHGLMQQYQLTTGNKDGASRFAYRSDAPAAAAHPPDIQQLLDKYKVPK